MFALRVKLHSGLGLGDGDGGSSSGRSEVRSGRRTFSPQVSRAVHTSFTQSSSYTVICVVMLRLFRTHDDPDSYITKDQMLAPTQSRHAVNNPLVLSNS